MIKKYILSIFYTTIDHLFKSRVERIKLQVEYSAVNKAMNDCAMAINPQDLLERLKGGV